MLISWGFGEGKVRRPQFHGTLANYSISSTGLQFSSATTPDLGIWRRSAAFPLSPFLALSCPHYLLQFTPPPNGSRALPALTSRASTRATFQPRIACLI